MARKPYRPELRLRFTRTRPAEVDEEFQFHLAMRTAALERAGHAPARAREIALAEFGDIEDARAYCRAEDERRMRDYRRTLWIDHARHDVLLALRTLRRHPAFAFSAVLTLGIAIALAIAAYGVVHAYLVRPLPYPDADRIVRVRATPGDEPFADLPDFSKVDWRIADSVFASTVEWNLDAFTVVGRDRSESVRGAWVSPGYFSAFGMTPAVGRPFTPDEYRGGQSVAIISDALWSRQFGRDPSIIGRASRLHSGESESGAELVTIVGVLPADAWHTHRFTEILRPLGTRSFPAMAVLRPGMPIAEAAERLNALVRPQLSNVHPSWRMSLVGLQEDYTERLRPTLVALLAGACFLLLIAAASVAGVQAARAAARRGEVQVRVALGASRGRILAQFLTETLVLAGLAGVLGAAIAGGALATFGPIVAEQVGASIPGGSARLALDAGTLVLVAAAAALLGAMIGILPALMLTRRSALAGASAGALGATRGSAHAAPSPALRRSLIVAQVAFTMMLLVGAGLMGRTILTIVTTPLGFQEDGVLKGDLFLPISGYGDDNARRRGVERVLDAVGSLPDVRGVAVALPDPLRTFTLPPARVITERSAPSDSGRPAWSFTVSPGWFDVLEVPLLAGRRFTAADDAGAVRVAIVSRDLARTLWPDRSPIGARFRVAGDSVWHTVVGVVGDIREPVESTPTPELYYPFAQHPEPIFTVMARVSGDPARVALAMQRAVTAADDLLGMSGVEPLRALTERASQRHRALGSVLSVFALLALGLAMLGLHASLAYVVAQRRREIAIRVAVGADRRAIRRLVLREGVPLVAAGLALGLVLSLALTRLLASQLYGVTPTDPATFAAIIAFLGACAVLASLAPAREATRVEPGEIMRSE